jgi:hypothetical protein
MNKQGILDLEGVGSEEGHEKWVACQRLAVSEMARRLNLPLGHEVEVILNDGVCLRGRLRLQEDLLFVEEERIRLLELKIGRVGFTYRDIQSCVRLD